MDIKIDSIEHQMFELKEPILAEIKELDAVNYTASLSTASNDIRDIFTVTGPDVATAVKNLVEFIVRYKIAIMQPIWGVIYADEKIRVFANSPIMQNIIVKKKMSEARNAIGQEEN